MYIYIPTKTFNPEKHFKNISLYQGDFFRRWQLSAKHHVVALAIDGPDTHVRTYIQCVEHRIPLLGSVWTARHGPLGSFDSVSIEEAFYHDLRRYCTDIAPRTIHIRIQRAPTTKRIRMQMVKKDTEKDQVVLLNQETAGVVKDSLERAPSTAKHTAVQVHLETVDFKTHLADVYALIEQTVSDAQPFSYYEALFSQLHENPEYAALTLGYVNGKKTPSAAALTVYTGNEARLVLAAAHSDADTVFARVIYTAMKEAMQQDLKRYVFSSHDLSGVVPRLEFLIQDTFHTTSKDHSTMWDIVVSSWRYYIFRGISWHPIAVVCRFLKKWITIALVELRTEYQR